MISAIRYISVSISLICPLSAFAEDLSLVMLEFGNPRTALHALLSESPEGADQIINVIGRHLGLVEVAHGYPYVASSAFRIAPSIRYENNSNGGLIADAITINDISFEVDEQSRAIPDFTAGVSLEAGLSIAAGPGITFGASTQLSWRKGIQHGFNIRERAAQLSAQKSFNNWAYIDFSIMKFEKDSALLRTDDKYAIITAGKVISTQTTVRDISASYLRYSDSYVWQNRARINFEHGSKQGYVVKSSLEIGEIIKGSNLPVTSITTSLATNIFGKPSTISVGYTVEEGSNFLGRNRRDEISSVSARYQVTQNIELGVLFENRKSSIAELSLNSLGLNASWTPFRF